jgi:hypothetical protein
MHLLNCRLLFVLSDYNNAFIILYRRKKNTKHTFQEALLNTGIPHLMNNNFNKRVRKVNNRNANRKFPISTVI